jgi:hypothetical protein
MVVENGEVIFFVTEELLRTHPYPILRGSHVNKLSLTAASVLVR